jgi:peptide/nickel transport system substrate-binding protein
MGRRCPTRALLPVLVTCALTLLICGLSACANSSPGASRHLTVLAEADVDSLDPGVTNYQFGLMVVSAMQQTLFAYKPGLREPVPQLAAQPADVSADGRTVEVTIRPGVRFAPPVNRVVTAADVKYAFERAFLPSVANGYARTYFGTLLGLQAYLRGTNHGITGIVVRDSRRLAFRFSSPVGGVAASAMSLPITAPVPPEYARAMDRKKRSTYGLHPASTGPFMLSFGRGDPGPGGYAPDHHIELVRNPNWQPTPAFGPPALARISIREGFAPSIASRRILSGRGEVNGDFQAPPDVIAAHWRDPRLVTHASGGVAYVALNTRVPPFNNVEVRRAVAAVLNRTAMRAALGGRASGQIASHFIPPGVPGFQRAGGAAGPRYDFDSRPAGDPAVAARYMRLAGYSSGRYEGDADIIVAANSDPAAARVAQIVEAGLERLGIPATLRLLPEDSLGKLCGSVPTEVGACANAGWLKEFNDPQTMLDAPFSGAAITHVGNPNLSLLNDPRLNAEIARAESLIDQTAREAAWAALDREISAQAPAVPWLWPSAINLRSADVSARVNPETGRWDLASIRIARR